MFAIHNGYDRTSANSFHWFACFSCFIWYLHLFKLTSLFTHSREWQFACKFIKENSIFKLFLPTVVIVENHKKECFSLHETISPLRTHKTIWGKRKFHWLTSLCVPLGISLVHIYLNLVNSDLKWRAEPWIYERPTRWPVLIAQRDSLTTNSKVKDFEYC